MADQDPPSTSTPPLATPSATAARPAPQPPKADVLPPWRVLLHNDDVNSFDWVIDTIVELTPHRKPMAQALALEAHTTGVALVLVTHKERAELYRDQFTSKGLTVTIEPAG